MKQSTRKEFIAVGVPPVDLLLNIDVILAKILNDDEVVLSLHKQKLPA
ncbi:hypothetical protein QUB80_31815 [Chlorogloeopsis sp. ULAP01]|nr:hypothetical protein [Chlorogloeopsis sp. ULAP01]MDM9385243.1 hypothetical protein [Chlorogloeopsis sp. ULAP01]